MWGLFTLLGDFAFLGGIILQLYGFLSPVPWFSSNTNNSLFRFLPYEVPDGYVPPNACQGGALSNATVHLANVSHQLPRDEPILRFKRETSVKRASNTANYSQAAIWIGALGSCNRDVDGKVYCTKPSYSNPQYNLTNVAPNSVFYTAMLPDVVHRRTILATISLNVVGYVFYFLGSIPFWFPGIYSSLCGSTKDSAQALGIIFLVYQGLSFVTQFFMNFTIRVTRIGSYNSIDNFYDPAPCGQARPLKPGILLKAAQGNMYPMIWTGWCLIFLVSTWFLVGRMAWLDSNYSKAAEDYSRRATTKAAREKEKKEKKEATQEERRKAKEEKEFRKKVEKEKVAMAARTELENEKKVADLEESKSIRSDSTAVNSLSAV